MILKVYDEFQQKIPDTEYNYVTLGIISHQFITYLKYLHKGKVFTLAFHRMKFSALSQNIAQVHYELEGKRHQVKILLKSSFETFYSRDEYKKSTLYVHLTVSISTLDLVSFQLVIMY